VADQTKTMFVWAGGLNIRQDPNTSSKVVGTMTHGESVVVNVSANKVVDGTEWTFVVMPKPGWSAVKHGSTIYLNDTQPPAPGGDSNTNTNTNTAPEATVPTGLVVVVLLAAWWWFKGRKR